MKLPKSWNEILVDQYVELRGLEVVPSSSFVDKDVEILSIVSDTDKDDFDDFTFKEVNGYLKELSWIKKEPPKNVVKNVGELFYKGMQFTLGEYIELNHFFSDDFVKNLPVICAILFRKKLVNKWGQEIIEPYEYDPNERAALFLELPITSVYGIIGEFLTYKESFEDTYKNLLNDDLSGEPEVLEEDKKEQEEEDRQNKWSWEHLVYDSCNGDITKRDEVLSLDLVFVFNMLSMKKDLKLE